MISVNLVSVLVAALAAFIIGFLAHGPVSGKLWMKLANITPTGNEKFSGMVPQMLWNLLVNFISAYVLAVMYSFASSAGYMGGAGVSTGIACAVWLWLGFNITATSIEVIWMKRSVKLWLFECISSLVAFIAMGAIIAGM